MLTFPDSPAALLEATLDVALSGSSGPLVLAVSGGLDSMALMYAVARWAPDRIAAVATFDHGTGAYATEAASLVAAQARRLGLTVVRERARTVGRTEAAWRDARWQFLERVAKGFRARVATAHTRDDQLETIVMRFLRGAGARGLAALAAPSPVIRPWLSVTRAELAAWVAEEQIAYLDDPMNTDRRLLRARVRHDLLPMLTAAQPSFAADWLALGERAAQWRRDVDRFLEHEGLVVSPDGRRVLLPSRILDDATPEARAVLWPAICARAGVTLDATGTQAAVRFTTTRRRGAQLPLAGGALLLRRREGAHEVFEVRHHAPAGPMVDWQGTSDALPPRFGRWRFRRLGEGAPSEGGDPWMMALPAGKPVVVRAWAPGDRIVTVGAPAGRRVTRYFSESRVPVPDRPSWPVVLIDDVPAWVPGVCCAAAAPSRPGRSDLIWYRCERERD
ncbi:MAG: tRNA lysidine(34) synthetase TilS [Gemmatimonadaceae bacterium]|nr:tRNA lysidine(34) synthetase TilS [Gemmatimonadaceae bacterium]